MYRDSAHFLRTLRGYRYKHACWEPHLASELSERKCVDAWSLMSRKVEAGEVTQDEQQLFWEQIGSFNGHPSHPMSKVPLPSISHIHVSHTYTCLPYIYVDVVCTSTPEVARFALYGMHSSALIMCCCCCCGRCFVQPLPLLSPLFLPTISSHLISSHLIPSHLLPIPHPLSFHISYFIFHRHGFR
jgi:hypothetical protein